MRMPEVLQMPHTVFSQCTMLVKLSENADEHDRVIKRSGSGEMSSFSSQKMGM